MIAAPNAPKKEGLSQRTRWVIHFLILCWPIALTVIVFKGDRHSGLPENGAALVRFILLELLIWGVAFTAAFRVSRITVQQLCLVTKSPIRAIGWGILWFVVIRVATHLLIHLQSSWLDPRAFWPSEEKSLEFVHAQNIARHPAFSFTVFGITAFIAGFSEELWRVGMLRGLGGIFPGLRGKTAGGLASILLVSLIFGLGHLYEGWLGVENAVLTGLFFGLILFYRRSYWEIAIAHTLFDVSASVVVSLLALSPYMVSAQIIEGAATDNIPKIQYFLGMGGNINAPLGSKGTTALEAAARKPHPEMVRFLLEKGADPNAQDANGLTPLMVAAILNQSENMNILFSKGAHLNEQNYLGFTALRFAVEEDQVEAANLLIRNGADVNLADKSGTTPLAVAQRRGETEMVTLLQQNGGK